MNYKEYSRLRSIARKRIERASAAGFGEYIFLPTVKQIKESGMPELFMQKVQDFLNTGVTLTTARKEKTTLPKLDIVQLPKPKPVTDEMKKARKREQNRRSKAKRAVVLSSGSEAEARKKVGYLKALETVSAKWRDAGVDVGNWLGVMSPGMSKKFVDYMEYRFSQGDYKNRYTIDTFIRDFGTLVQKGYNFNDIKADFGSFLQKQKELGKGQRRTNKYGITEDEVDSAWRKFVNR